ncbi:hypothetical protein B296_00009538 [Ensete ventricosum]|uniref:Uncharacterized protein n=1 Tax=Ensete ventricosum TaxID=4639 RepID=A0A427AM90_ENSVE|nr:hypothetical protein B296_00009538 [Ensete ventricosum]
MSSSSSNEERNFGDCSLSESSFSLDEKSSKVLEAILREHDEDSIITESSLSKIWAIYCIPGDFDIHVPEAEQHPFNTFPNGFSLSVDALEAGPHGFLVLRHRPTTELTAEKALSTEAEPPLKRLKKVGDSAVPAKEASPAPAPRPRSGP